MTDCNRILLVEPDGIVQKAEMGCLKHSGAEVDIASNGNSALDKAQTSIYDFILIGDHMDEGLNGFELVREIKHHSLNKKTQCAILGFDDTYENTAKAAGLGVWYFARPIVIDKARDILGLAKEFSTDNKLK